LLEKPEEFVRRATIQELEAEFLAKEEYWDTIIIEPTTINEVKGYLGLEPASYTKKNSVTAV